MGSAFTGKVALRVGIDARLMDGLPGGVQQVIVGLAHGLSRLSDGNEEYVFFVYPQHSEWLAPFVGGACRLQHARQPPRWKMLVAERFPPALTVNRLVKHLAGGATAPRVSEQYEGVPASDGAAEAAGVDVMHFPKQDAFLTSIPSIYHPHDLQHLHFPEFFSQNQYRARETNYRAFCQQATLVSVTSEWTRRDLIEKYGLASSKVAVVHLAPALSAYQDVNPEDLETTRRRYALPENFVFYPAQTWPHKNHIRLLHALALLRQARGVNVPLVCSGTKNCHYPAIAGEAQRLGLVNSTIFTGFVEPRELQALYALCRAVVFPSLFEAAGGFGPISEAFVAGRAVACSNVTSLPDEVGDAALIFDPFDIEGISHCVWRLWTEPELRADLEIKGRIRVSRYDWVKTARTFRAHYRRIGHRRLESEDLQTFSEPTYY